MSMTQRKFTKIVAYQPCWVTCWQVLQTDLCSFSLLSLPLLVTDLEWCWICPRNFFRIWNQNPKKLKHRFIPVFRRPSGYHSYGSHILHGFHPVVVIVSKYRGISCGGFWIPFTENVVVEEGWAANFCADGIFSIRAKNCCISTLAIWSMSYRNVLSS